ncbi:ROK family glucokinase [Georgenia thermotolerans]|uniref:Glucokinase n=1 Tax=Georgenia thermotolerans TaxID=527326 RepID=A0A7J5UP10_9MICO|nr:ROK family glucokinase [Georgenia thermotolerans]KAE8763844.1 ROK family glucokinase [Georgenia thermotolerans]
MDAIGVDIGGTKIAAGVVDDAGVVRAQRRYDTDPTDPVAIESAVIRAVNELRAEHQVAAVGVAAAGYVSPQRDGMVFAPNIAWRDYPLRERLAPGIDLPIVIENDANAAGWAEFRFGRGRHAESMVMLTVGTGLGGAIIVDGRLLRGAFGAAGEIGHMQMVPSGRYCGCGHEGCWEMYGSGRALTRAARAAAVAYPDRARAIIELAGGPGQKIKGPHVTQAAQAGDPLAIELLAELGAWLGAGISDLAAIVDPEMAVIGGGVAEAGALLLEPARESFNRHLTARGFRGELTIHLAELGNEAGIVGAADLART